jgi:hypothetical protein
MRECWFPRRKRMIPAYRVRVHRKSRAGRSEWIVFIYAQLGIVLSKYDNLAEATARTQVFDPQPTRTTLRLDRARRTLAQAQRRPS